MPYAGCEVGFCLAFLNLPNLAGSMAGQLCDEVISLTKASEDDYPRPALRACGHTLGQFIHLGHTGTRCFLQHPKFQQLRDVAQRGVGRTLGDRSPLAAGEPSSLTTT